MELMIYYILLFFLNIPVKSLLYLLVLPTVYAVSSSTAISSYCQVAP